MTAVSFRLVVICYVLVTIEEPLTTVIDVTECDNSEISALINITCVVKNTSFFYKILTAWWRLNYRPKHAVAVLCSLYQIGIVWWVLVGSLYSFVSLNHSSMHVGCYWQPYVRNIMFTVWTYILIWTAQHVQYWRTKRHSRLLSYKLCYVYCI